MRDCTGAEILKELLHQLHWEEHQEESWRMSLMSFRV